MEEKTAPNKLFLNILPISLASPEEPVFNNHGTLLDTALHKELFFERVIAYYTIVRFCHDPKTIQC
jgi:hypothetical protein